MRPESITRGGETQQALHDAAIARPALPDFDRAALEDALARVMPAPRLIAVSARTGEWIQWMEGLCRRQPFSGAAGPPG
jgi:hypothetical protein